MLPRDLDAYRARIGHAGTAGPTLGTLGALHRAHVGAVPFENLDIQMGITPRLDRETLLDKIVRRRRGGYCFEQNTLFLDVLRTLGFDAVPCEARVRVPEGRLLPRTHMVLLVRLDGRRWLCDVGFGGHGLLEPLPLDGRAHAQPPWHYACVEEADLRVLQLRRGDRWEDQYAFVAQERFPIDFEVGNWYTATWPESPFVTTLTVQRASPEARHVLRNLTYTCDDASGAQTLEIARPRLVGFLRETFGVDLPEDVRFRALDRS